MSIIICITQHATLMDFCISVFTLLLIYLRKVVLESIFNAAAALWYMSHETTWPSIFVLMSFYHVFIWPCMYLLSFFIGSIGSFSNGSDDTTFLIFLLWYNQSRTPKTLNHIAIHHHHHHHHHHKLSSCQIVVLYS